MSDGGLADVLSRLGLAVAGPPLVSENETKTCAREPMRERPAMRPEADLAPPEPERTQLVGAANVPRSLRAAFDGGASLQAVIAASGTSAGRARRQLLKECFGIDVPSRGTLPTRIEAESLLKRHEQAIRRAAERADGELDSASSLGLEEWTLGWLILVHRDRSRGPGPGREALQLGVGELSDAGGSASSANGGHLRPWPGRPETPAERRASAAYLRGAGIIRIAAEADTTTAGALSALVRGLAGVLEPESPPVERIDPAPESQHAAVLKFDAGMSIGRIADLLDQSQTAVALLLLADRSGRLRELN